MNQIQLIKAPSLWTGDELAVRENLYVNLEKSHMSEIKNLASVDSSKDLSLIHI